MSISSIYYMYPDGSCIKQDPKDAHYLPDADRPRLLRVLHCEVDGTLLYHYSEREESWICLSIIGQHQNSDDYWTSAGFAAFGATLPHNVERISDEEALKIILSA